MQLRNSLNILWHCLSLGLDCRSIVPAVQETQVQFLGWEDPLEKETATHSSTLAWKTPGTEQRGRLHFSSVQLLCRVQLFVTPSTVACQAPLSMGFFRQEYWSGLPFSPPEDLPDPGTEPGSSVLQADLGSAGGCFTP